MPEAPILLAEDNPDDEALALRAFKRSGVVNEIAVVRDGQEALDYLFGDEGAAGPSPPMIILDLKLPKVDGLEVLRRIRATERTRLIPVVILTGSHEEADLIDTYASGANSYVRKAVDFNEFAESVRQLSLYWLSVNEVPPPPVTVS